MCPSKGMKRMKLILTIPLLILGVFVAFNFPELRQYLRIYAM